MRFDDLYIIQNEAGHLKIGRASDPFKRLAQLQTGSSTPLKILQIYKGLGFAEVAFHNEFADYRLMGEWFKADVAGLLKLQIEQIAKDKRVTTETVIWKCGDCRGEWDGSPDQGKCVFCDSNKRLVIIGKYD